MQAIANQLEALINLHYPSLLQLKQEDLIIKPSPLKWSKQEIIGHLADSAESNIRRFVVAQYEEEPFIVYNQDKWVSINNYQQWNSKELIQLWYSLNIQACHILSNTNTATAQRSCRSESVHSIEWLASDYILHLRHHLHQVLDLEPVPYP
jgi:hypothetical protein